MRKIISILLCLVMVLGTAANAFADTSKGSATTLRLEKTEGKVGMTKGDGKAVTIKDGIRLYDGYDLKTDKKSAAYISLDSAKAVMMDASTNVSIKKSGNKLDIMLKSGTILLNVEDKLKGNEELNIRTTNSVTGIRGTIIQASYNPLTQNTEIYLFEGETMGTYLAPDGTWYNQRLTTGSWLASGMGRLEENPQYNGWTVGPNGEWIYTNNKIEGTEFQQWRWSAERGWYTYDTRTSAITKLEAWPFTFKDLQPRVQEWILGDTDMLSRGRQHLDLYPELAENSITATRETAGIVLSQQQEDIEKQDAAIQTAFEEGNGGNTVDNLFKGTGPSAPSVPTYAMVYLMDDPATGGTTYTTQYYKEGDPVTAPADPTREGYTFAGWSSALPDAKAKEEETVYATWEENSYTITFDSNGGEFEVTPEDITDVLYTDRPAVSETAPILEGYDFIGWSTEAVLPGASTSGISIINAGRPITEALSSKDGDTVTLYAVWKINQYTITFDTDGGNTIAPITQDYASAITPPADPTKTGYTFAGWDESVPTTMPADNMTITAQWTINQYTISFVDSDGVTPISDSITDNYGTAITPPSDPEKEGYTFTDWDPAIPATMPGEDTTVKAQWRVNSYTITFLMKEGGDLVGTITKNYGATIDLSEVPADPTRDGFVFTGWDKTIPTTMPAENTTIIAQWNQLYAVNYFTNNDKTELIKTDYYAPGETIVPDDTYTVTGYIVNGWVYDDPAAPAGGSALPTNMGTADIDCWPELSPKTYSISYNANGGTIITPAGPEPTAFVYDDEDCVSEDGYDYYEKTGYGFYGWAFTSNPASGDTIIKRGESFYNYRTEIAESADGSNNLTLYAVWRPVAVITFNATAVNGYMGNLRLNPDDPSIVYSLDDFTDAKSTCEYTIYSDVAEAKFKIYEGTNSVVIVKDDAGNNIVTDKNVLTISPVENKTIKLESTSNLATITLIHPDSVTISDLVGDFIDFNNSSTTSTVLSSEMNGDVSFKVNAAAGATITATDQFSAPIDVDPDGIITIRYPNTVTITITIS